MAKTVLVAEDDDLSRKLVCDLLGASGIGTLQARSAREAVKLALERRPDLVVVDIRLPDLSGADLAQLIRADPRLHAIPVVAVTAFGSETLERELLDAGCAAFFQKPISTLPFLHTIRRLLESPPSRNPSSASLRSPSDGPVGASSA